MAGFSWKTLWPLFGGLLGCLSYQVTSPTGIPSSNVPRLSLFVRKDPLNNSNHASDRSSQTYSFKIFNDSDVSESVINEIKVKPDLRTRLREGRQNLDDVSNCVNNNTNETGSLEPFSNFARSSDSFENKNDDTISKSKLTYLYNTFYANHPLVQKLSDTKPQTFSADESGSEYSDEFSSEYQDEPQVNNTSAQSEELNARQAANNYQTWYKSLYDAGRSFNSPQSDFLLRPKDTSPPKMNTEFSESEPEEVFRSLRHSNKEKREKRFPGYVSNTSPNKGGSSFNVGYSIGVTNSNSNDNRSPRTAFKPFPVSLGGRPSHNVHTESQASPSYYSSTTVHRPPSAINILKSGFLDSVKLVGNAGKSPQPHHSTEPPPDIITLAPNVDINPREPYRYETAGADTVWKHVAPNLEVSASSNVHKPGNQNPQNPQNLQHPQNPQNLQPPQHPQHPQNSQFNVQFETLPKPDYLRDERIRDKESLQQNPNPAPFGNTGQHSMGNGQAFYFYSGNGVSGSNNDGKTGASSFDHNHALGQSNIFDLSNALFTFAPDLAMSQVTEQTTEPDRGSLKTTEHADRENREFEEQLRSMLEGQTQRVKPMPSILDSLLAAQVYRPKNVTQIKSINLMRPTSNYPAQAAKNSVQNVIIPMPNGNNVQMPAIIIPLGPQTGALSAQTNPVIASNGGMNLLEDGRDNDPVVITSKQLLRSILLGVKNGPRLQPLTSTAGSGPQGQHGLNGPSGAKPMHMRPGKRPKPNSGKPNGGKREEYMSNKPSSTQNLHHVPAGKTPHSYYYYHLNSDQSPKATEITNPAMDPENPIFSAGTSLLSSSLFPTKTESVEDPAVDAAVANIVAKSNLHQLLQDIKNDPGSEAKAPNDSGSDSSNQNTVQSMDENSSSESNSSSDGSGGAMVPMNVGASNHSHQSHHSQNSHHKHKSKKKHRKPSSSSATNSSSILTSPFTPAGLATAGFTAGSTDPEYSYGYGFNPFTDPYATALYYPSFPGVLPTKGGLRYNYPYDGSYLSNYGYGHSHGHGHGHGHGHSHSHSHGKHHHHGHSHGHTSHNHIHFSKNPENLIDPVPVIMSDDYFNKYLVPEKGISKSVRVPKSPYSAARSKSKPSLRRRHVY